MDASSVARRATLDADERNRVVPIPRRWNQPPGREPGGTVANKPGTPRRSRISRKPSRRECRSVRRTCHDLRACLLPFCTQGCGCVSASGIPCALCSPRDHVDAKPGHDSCRGNARSRHRRIAGWAKALAPRPPFVSERDEWRARFGLALRNDDGAV